MVGFLAGRNEGNVTPDSIDDRAVLDFWLENSAVHREGSDFKAYRTVFQTAVQLIEALVCALERWRMDTPRPIGPDRDAGDVDPEAVLDAVTAIDERPNLLRLAVEPPMVSIKFLNRREADVLESLAAGGSQARRLARSVMRNAVFGKAQSRVTNFLRGRPEATEVAAFIEDAAEEDYADRVGRYRRLGDHLDRVLLAALYALARMRRAEAITLVLRLRPGIELESLKENLAQASADNVVSLSAHAAGERFLDMLGEPERLEGELALLMGEAREAFRSLSRKGFAEKDLDDAVVREGFAVSVDALVAVRREIADFVDCSGGNGDWQRTFAEDRATFQRQFRILYGGGDDT